MNDYWFFLSHAKRDNLNGLPKQFFDLLAAEVGKSAKLHSSVRTEEIGFFDETSIETGDLSDEKMARALQSCKALVCLYSRSYFVSDWCGREFQVFADRLDAHVGS